MMQHRHNIHLDESFGPFQSRIGACLFSSGAIVDYPAALERVSVLERRGGLSLFFGQDEPCRAAQRRLTADWPIGKGRK